MRVIYPVNEDARGQQRQDEYEAVGHHQSGFLDRFFASWSVLTAVETVTSTAIPRNVSAAPTYWPLTGLSCAMLRPTATGTRCASPMRPLVGSNATQPAQGR